MRILPLFLLILGLARGFAPRGTAQRKLKPFPESVERRSFHVGRDQSIPHHDLTHSLANTRLRASFNADERNWPQIGFFAVVSFLYWYWMVLGAAAVSNGLPGVPDFIPQTPGWPATDKDFVPVVEDSYHFFYLSELLENQDAPYVSPVRLASFNLAEAWIFSYLPALWKDSQRLPRPVLLLSWATLDIGLTNAFLGPYLFLT